MNKLSLAVTTVLIGLALHPVQAENLLQVYQKAKGYDAQLQAQETNYLATLESKTQALASKKPQVGLSGGITYNRSDVFFDASSVSDSSHSNNWTAKYSLSATKPLYNKPLDRKIDQVDANIAQAGAGLEEQRQSLILRVAQSYFNFLLTQDGLEFAQAQKQTAAQQLKQVNAFFNAGRVAVTDVRETQSNYDAIVAKEVSALQQLSVAREALRVLTGVSYQSVNAPNASLALVMPKPDSVDAWIGVAMKSNKALITQQKAVEVARRAVDVERAAKKPTVNLVASHGGSWNEGDSALDQRAMSWSIGVNADLSVYDGGSMNSQIRQAQQQFLAAQQNYEYQMRQAEEQVRSAYLSIQSAIAQANATKQAVLSAETAAKATKVGFDVGTRTSVDMFNAITSLYNARQSHASARYTFLLNILNLRNATGTLSERDLQQMSQYLTQPPSLKAGALGRSDLSINLDDNAGRLLNDNASRKLPSANKLTLPSMPPLTNVLPPPSLPALPSLPTTPSSRPILYLDK